MEKKNQNRVLLIALIVVTLIALLEGAYIISLKNKGREPGGNVATVTGQNETDAPGADTKATEKPGNTEGNETANVNSAEDEILVGSYAWLKDREMQTPTEADMQYYALNVLSDSVNFASNYDGSFSASEEVIGRSPVYFYHPAKLILSDQTKKAVAWISSDASVIRVTNAGAVEAYSEGIADVTAYDAAGQPIETFFLYATTYGDADPIGSYYDYDDIHAIIDVYSSVRYEDLQSTINTMVDYSNYIFARDMYYEMSSEGTAPESISQRGCRWMQASDSDWIFKKEAGICYNVCAGALYTLAGDYEEYGTIQMAGPNGHTIFYCKENGTYYIHDYTRDLEYSQHDIINIYGGNVYAYFMDTTFIGETLEEAFEKACVDTFYLTNKIIYAVNLTGMDYYPCESNSWSQGANYDNPVLNVAEGTKIHILYEEAGLSLTIREMPREKMPEMLMIVRDFQNTEDTVTDDNYGRLAGIEGRGIVSSKAPKLTAFDSVAEYTQSELLGMPNTKTGDSKSLSEEIVLGTREAVYTGHTKQLTLAKEDDEVAYFYSTDANIIRVSSTGLVRAYSRGIADVYAVAKDGTVIEKFELYGNTYADENPMGYSLAQGTDYKKILFEDIPEKLNTMTDLAQWFYDNDIYYGREPDFPKFEIVNVGTDSIVWMDTATKKWAYLDRQGICYNFAGAALYALRDDYDEYGLIMMSGSYGHVINYFCENGRYYVLDYTASVGDNDWIRQRYSGNAYEYVKDKAGTGSTLKEAFYNYADKNRYDYYFYNIFIYSLDMTGYDFYPSEANNFSCFGLEVAYEDGGKIYHSQFTNSELLYLEDGMNYEFITLPREEIIGRFNVEYDLNSYTSMDLRTEFSPKNNPKQFASGNYASGSNYGGNGSDSGQSSGDYQSGVGSGVAGMDSDPSRFLWSLQGGGDSFYFMGIADGVDYPEELYIADEVDGKKVNGICDYALCGKEGVRYLHIPASIESIGENAFYAMRSDLVVYCVKGSFADKYCTGLGMNVVYE